MSQLNELLHGQAARGERAYSAVGASGAELTDFVAGVRAARRRRQWGTAVLSLGALAVVGASAISLTGRWNEPATVPTTPGTVVWSVDMGSESWSSPATVNGLVVAAADDGVIRAVDGATGESMWEVQTGGSIRSALVVSDGLVYASSLDGSVYAVTASGDVQWVSQVSPADVVRAPWEPMSAAPLLVGEAVCLGDRVGTVTCLDRTDGSVIWTSRVGGRVTAQAASDGDLLFVGADDAHVYALALDTGVEVWRMEVGGAVASALAASEGVVVAGNRGTAVVGLEAATGRHLWTVPMGTSWAESAPVVVDGTVYFGSSVAGQVVGVDIHDGDVEWRAHVGGMPWARPAAHGSMIYAAVTSTQSQEPADAGVYAIDRFTGKVLWSVQAGPALRWQPEGQGYGVATQPLVTEDLVIFTALDGVLYAVAR